MDLDWCSNDDTGGILFNDSVITNIKDSGLKNKPSENKMAELTLEGFLNINVEVSTPQDLLYVFNYLTFVSNKLRNIVRNRCSLNLSKIKVVKELPNDKILYTDLIKYLNKIYDATNSIKKYFNSKYKKEFVFENIKSTGKLFKTSSYKFCTFKDSCKIHKNKNKVCDKNHFVFDMLLLDLSNLIESIEIISVNDNNNFFHVVDDYVLLYNITNNTVEKHGSYNEKDTNENLVFIDKNTVYKCFDVISYVFNRMYEEAYLFLNYNIFSELINMLGIDKHA
jgi:hypothetical protein